MKTRTLGVDGLACLSGDSKLSEFDSIATALNVPLWVLFIPTLKAEDLQSPKRERLVALVESYLNETDANIPSELKKALDALEHVDALVSTAACSIVSGDACDAHLVTVLQNYAWPKIEETREAIEAALKLVGEPQENPNG